MHGPAGMSSSIHESSPDPSSARFRIGTAGWSLPKAEQDAFPVEGTHLERYAARFPAVEINSSFYRPHRPSTYARWAESVPAGFRFAVKVPRAITHERRLRDAGDALDGFLAEATALGPALGCLLVQLPPSLAYDAKVVEAFLRALRARHDGAVALEPRHATWFTPEAERPLLAHGIARVAADPAKVPAAAEPAGDPRVVYYRLHGSPRIYYSDYDDAYLDALAVRMLADAHADAARDVWCIFDNTALGCATKNALALMERLRDDD
ncbi:hypothetical protein rosag_22430 [Roseisolibacter agri]|uniref:DUF72 domain-containing protein n=2 Tax=Roseisolibacter agri TaxID=2014610 RepID=A0AA37Q366_9BACT|nr:hypothetical protein rosag_22430 [Roseisolibacter agri]